MIWVLLAVGIVLVALAALAVAILRTWRVTKQVARDLGRASQALDAASVDLPKPSS